MSALGALNVNAAVGKSVGLFSQDMSDVLGKVQRDLKTFRLTLVLYTVSLALMLLGAAYMSGALAQLLRWYFPGLPLWTVYGFVGVALFVSAALMNRFGCLCVRKTQRALIERVNECKVNIERLLFNSRHELKDELTHLKDQVSPISYASKHPVTAFGLSAAVGLVLSGAFPLSTLRAEFNEAGMEIAVGLLRKHFLRKFPTNG